MTPPDPAVESMTESFRQLCDEVVMARMKIIDDMRLAAAGLGLGVRVTFGPSSEMLVEASKDVPLGEVEMVRKYH